MQARIAVHDGVLVEARAIIGQARIVEPVGGGPAEGLDVGDGAEGGVGELDRFEVRSREVADGLADLAPDVLDAPVGPLAQFGTDVARRHSAQVHAQSAPHALHLLGAEVRPESGIHLGRAEVVDGRPVGRAVVEGGQHAFAGDHPGLPFLRPRFFRMAPILPESKVRSETGSGRR